MKLSVYTHFFFLSFIYDHDPDFELEARGVGCMDSNIYKFYCSGEFTHVYRFHLNTRRKWLSFSTHSHHEHYNYRVNNHQINLAVVCLTQQYLYALTISNAIFSFHFSPAPTMQFIFQRLACALYLFLFFYYHYHYNEVLYILNHVHYLFTCCVGCACSFALKQETKTMSVNFALFWSMYVCIMCWLSLPHHILTLDCIVCESKICQVRE